MPPLTRTHSPGAYNRIMQSCYNKDPEQRPSFSGAKANCQIYIYNMILCCFITIEFSFCLELLVDLKLLLVSLLETWLHYYICCVWIRVLYRIFNWRENLVSDMTCPL